MNKEDKLIITIDDLIIEFASNITLGMKAIAAAAETYYTALRKYGDRAKQQFAHHFPTIRPHTWAILEDIGKGKLPPQATMMSSGAVDKIRSAKIPQKRLLALANRHVAVYNPLTDSYDTLPFSYLTEKQADIILNPITHSIRNKDQQKRYVARLTTTPTPSRRPKSRDYIITQTGIIFRKTTTISFEELQQILATYTTIPPTYPTTSNN